MTNRTADTQAAAIHPDHAAEMYDCSNGATAGPWTRVGRQHIRTSRWMEIYYLVVADEEGRYWGIRFDEGLTEEQENELPWDKAETPLPLTRLYPHKVTTTEYRTTP